MKVTDAYKFAVRRAAETIRADALPGATGHMKVCAGSLADRPGNLPGPFTLTCNGMRREVGDLCAALAAHAAWNTGSAVSIWHETASGRRLVLR